MATRKTPAPKTPAPKTPAPKTPAPKTPEAVEPGAATPEATAGRRWKVVDLGSFTVSKRIREAAGWSSDAAGRETATIELETVVNAAIEAHMAQYENKADDKEAALLKSALEKIEARKKARATQEVSPGE